MSENNQSMKGHAFCDVKRCKHCNNTRCDKLMLKDVSDFTVTDGTKCESYDEKLPRHFSVDLDEDEVNALMTLLEPSSDEGDPGEELYNKLWRLSSSNPVAGNMYYINAYDRRQQCGGPEEGGWWYHTVQCLQSIGYDCVGANEGEPDFQYLIDKFIEFIDLEDDETLPEKDIIETALREHNYYELGMLDNYGEGAFITIERQPGAQHKMGRQHYE